MRGKYELKQNSRKALEYLSKYLISKHMCVYFVQEDFLPVQNYLIYFAHITFSNYERKKWKPMEGEQSWTSVVILQPFLNPSLYDYFILSIYLL